MLITPVIMGWLFLHNVGEFVPLHTMVKQQLTYKNTCVVGLTTGKYTYDEYKLAMYQHIKPKVLILGSSRVMQFRQEYFSIPILNAGGVMSSIDQGFEYIQKALFEHTPDLIIIGLDYWWFHEDVPSVSSGPWMHPEHALSIRTYFLPYQWLFDKKITPSRFLKTIFNPMQFFSADFSHGFGADGQLNKTGFAKDGSYFYTKFINGTEPSADENFKHTFAEIDARQNKQDTSRLLYFRSGTTVNLLQFSKFVALTNFIKSKKVPMIIFIPPLAPDVIEKMSHFSSQYHYIDELRKKLTAAGLSYYDFHDPQFLPSSHCEFIDGFHGGDITYAKILHHIAMHDDIIIPFLDLEKILATIQRYDGLAMLVNPEISPLAEVDFLHLGCAK